MDCQGTSTSGYLRHIQLAVAASRILRISPRGDVGLEAEIWRKTFDQERQSDREQHHKVSREEEL